MGLCVQSESSIAKDEEKNSSLFRFFLDNVQKIHQNKQIVKYCQNSKNKQITFDTREKKKEGTATQREKKRNKFTCAGFLFGFQFDNKRE